MPPRVCLEEFSAEADCLPDQFVEAAKAISPLEFRVMNGGQQLPDFVPEGEGTGAWDTFEEHWLQWKVGPSTPDCPSRNLRFIGALNPMTGHLDENAFVSSIIDGAPSARVLIVAGYSTTQGVFDTAQFFGFINFIQLNFFLSPGECRCCDLELSFMWKQIAVTGGTLDHHLGAADPASGVDRHFHEIYESGSPVFDYPGRFAFWDRQVSELEFYGAYNLQQSAIPGTPEETIYDDLVFPFEGAPIAERPKFRKWPAGSTWETIEHHRGEYLIGGWDPRPINKEVRDENCVVITPGNCNQILIDEDGNEQTINLPEFLEVWPAYSTKVGDNRFLPIKGYYDGGSASPLGDSGNPFFLGDDESPNNHPFVGLKLESTPGLPASAPTSGGVYTVRGSLAIAFGETPSLTHTCGGGCHGSPEGVIHSGKVFEFTNTYVFNDENGDPLFTHVIDIKGKADLLDRFEVAKPGLVTRVASPSYATCPRWYMALDNRLGAAESVGELTNFSWKINGSQVETDERFIRIWLTVAQCETFEQTGPNVLDISPTAKAVYTNMSVGTQWEDSLGRKRQVYILFQNGPVFPPLRICEADRYFPTNSSFDPLDPSVKNGCNPHGLFEQPDLFQAINENGSSVNVDKDELNKPFTVERKGLSLLWLP